MSGLFNSITKPFTSMLGMDTAKAQEKATKQQKAQYEQELLIAQNNSAIANQNAAENAADINTGGSAGDADLALNQARKKKTGNSVRQSLGL